MTVPLPTGNYNRRGRSRSFGVAAFVITLIWFFVSLFGTSRIMSIPSSYLFTGEVTHNFLAKFNNESLDEMKEKNSRVFVNYTSSEWEELWIENILDWETKRSICEQMRSKSQEEYLREFLLQTCTHHYPDKQWCVVHDGTNKVTWINKNTLEIRSSLPADLSSIGRSILKHKAFDFDKAPYNDNSIQKPKVFSKFVFYDETTEQHFVEFIEPLVSHLRHPLAVCVQGVDLLCNRGYIVPPPYVSKNVKKFYFDAGASRWNHGAGGPSLSYFTSVWNRNGIDFDHIEAYEGSTNQNIFYNTVPREFKSRTIFHQQWISSKVEEHSNSTPFVPFIIKQKVRKADYVLFKLDIDSGKIEQGTVDYILNTTCSDTYKYIDEFLWEHHVQGNYLLLGNWAATIAKGVTIADSYKLFLAMRKMGIRAHSWV